MYIPRLGAITENQKATDFLVELTNVFGGSFFSNNEANFRTALLVAKTEDAIGYLGMPANTPGTVLLGADHSRKIGEIMESEKARKKIITAYTWNLLNSLSLAWSKHPVGDIETLRTTLLDYISRVEVVRVNDSALGDKKNFGLVKLENVGTFKSPQVEEAIARFRKQASVSLK